MMAKFEDIDLHADVSGYFKIALGGFVIDPTANPFLKCKFKNNTNESMYRLLIEINKRITEIHVLRSNALNGIKLDDPNDYLTLFDSTYEYFNNTAFYHHLFYLALTFKLKDN